MLYNVILNGRDVDHVGALMVQFQQENHLDLQGIARRHETKEGTKRHWLTYPILEGDEIVRVAQNVFLTHI